MHFLPSSCILHQTFTTQPRIEPECWGLVAEHDNHYIVQLATMQWQGVVFKPNVWEKGNGSCVSVCMTSFYSAPKIASEYHITCWPQRCLHKATFTLDSDLDLQDQDSTKNVILKIKIVPISTHVYTGQRHMVNFVKVQEEKWKSFQKTSLQTR